MIWKGKEVLHLVLMKDPFLRIAKGLKKIEAGAQGEHKIARGYVPTETFSLHWIGEESFSKAVEEYLISEKNAVKQDIKILSHFTPFKKGEKESD